MLDFEVDRQRADRILRSIPGFERFDAKYDLYYQIIPEIRAAFAAIGLEADLREL